MKRLCFALLVLGSVPAAGQTWSGGPGDEELLRLILDNWKDSALQGNWTIKIDGNQITGNWAELRPTEGQPQSVRPPVFQMTPVNGSQWGCRAADGADGIYLRTTWDQVEPSRDQFDWDWLDARVEQALRETGRFQICVYGGWNAPSWVGNQSVQIEGRRVPLPWDQDVLDEITELQTAIARRFPRCHCQFVSGYAKQEMFGFPELKQVEGWEQLLANYTIAQATAIHEANPSALVGIMLAPLGNGNNINIVREWAAVESRRGWACVQSNALGGAVDLQDRWAWDDQIAFHPGASSWQAVETITNARFQKNQPSVEAAVEHAANITRISGSRFVQFYRYPLGADLEPIPWFIECLDKAYSSSGGTAVPVGEAVPLGP